MKVKTFILGWTIPLSYKPTKTSQLLHLFSWKFPHWVLCMKKIFRGVSICSLTYMWTQNADPSFHRKPPPPFELGEMKANCPLWNSVCTSDSKHGLEHLNLWLCARTLVFLLDRHVRHLELATRGRTSWSEFKFRPFLTIHFCFVFEKRPLERHNAFFF